jgi:hypothetical protein
MELMTLGKGLNPQVQCYQSAASKHEFALNFELLPDSRHVGANCNPVN